MSDSPKEVTVILVEESLAKSVIRVIVTCGEVITIIGVGVLLRSSAMQWCGFVMFWIIVFSRAFHARQNAVRFRGPQRLADELKRRFGVVAQEVVG